jgi:glutamine synthetase
LLPQSLGEAIEALINDRKLQEALGEKISRQLIELKQLEWIEYARHVSE